MFDKPCCLEENDSSCDNYFRVKFRRQPGFVAFVSWEKSSSRRHRKTILIESYTCTGTKWIYQNLQKLIHIPLV